MRNIIKTCSGLASISFFTAAVLFLANCAQAPKQPLEVGGFWRSTDSSYIQLIPGSSQFEGQARIFSRLGEPAFDNKPITYRARENMSEGRNYHLHLEGVPTPKKQPPNLLVIVIGPDRKISYGRHHYYRDEEANCKAHIKSDFVTFIKGWFEGKDDKTVVTSQVAAGMDILFEGTNDIPWDSTKPEPRTAKQDPSTFATIGSLTLSAATPVRNLKCVITDRSLDTEFVGSISPGSVVEIKKVETNASKQLILKTEKGDWKCSAEENGAASAVTIQDLKELATANNLRIFTPGEKAAIKNRIYNKADPKSFLEENP